MALVEPTPIPGLPGYGAKEDGTMWSQRHRHGHPDVWRQLSPIIDKDGYLAITLRAEPGGYARPYYVHRLMLLAFKGQPALGQEGRHLDGNPLNCRISNLAWGTHIENESDKLASGTRLMGETHHRAKLDSAQVERMRRLRKAGKKLTDLAAMFDVTQQTVSKICRGDRWRHLTEV